MLYDRESTTGSRECVGVASTGQALASRNDPDIIIEDEGEKAETESLHGLRNPYPQPIRMALLDWLKRNRHHPFVSTSEEYRKLREATGLNNSQIKASPHCPRQNKFRD